MALEAGTLIGHYEILGLLGAGGMGEVYHAADRTLGRDVALKILPSRLANEPGGVERFQREARAVAALTHPHIVTIYSVEHAVPSTGAGPGVHFLTMELVDGASLDRHIAPGGLSIGTLMAMARQLAHGLAAAHEKGIIHHDLKPANVMVTGSGGVKILDFGLAKRLSATDVAAATQSVATLTVDNEIAGTLPYMAPELLEGRPADARSDLWALGVMLVEMAAGIRPFRGPTGLALSSAILRDDPQIPAGIPPALEAVLRKLLAKNPSDRYRSASEIAAVLERLAVTDAAAGAPPSRRRATAPIAAGVVLLAVLGAGAWWLLGSPDKGTPGHAGIASIAVLPLENQSSEADQQYFADGMTEALISHLSAIDDLRVISRTSVMQFRNTTQSLREIAGLLKVDAVVEGAVMRTAENVRITARLIDAQSERAVWRGEYEKPLSDAIGLQREIANQIGREIRGELTAADTERLTRRTDVDPQAYQSYLRGRFYWNLRSSSDLKQAAAFFEDALKRDPGFALAHAGLADVYVLLGDFRDMLPAEAYRRARQSVDAALRLDPGLAEAHTTHAWLAFALDRDWTAAEQIFRRALQLNPGYATAHQWQGEFLAALGRFDEASAAMTRAQELDPLGLMPQAIHGWVAYIAGRYDEAIALCEAVLERDPGFRPARMYRAWTFMDQGRLDEAEREIRALLQTSASPGVPLATLGRIQARRGNRAAAQRAIDELRGLGYPPSFDIAKLHAELRQRDQTLQWLGQAEVERNSAVLYIKVDPAFRWLRGDRQFDALLKKLNLLR